MQTLYSTGVSSIKKLNRDMQAWKHIIYVDTQETHSYFSVQFEKLATYLIEETKRYADAGQKRGSRLKDVDLRWQRIINRKVCTTRDLGSNEIKNEK